MPPALLALMIQSAFRVTFERESLRIAFLFGVVPSLVAFGIGHLATALFALDAEDSLIATILGIVPGFVIAVPFAVRAAGGLLHRLLGREPVVLPRQATGRALAAIGLILGLGVAVGLVLGLIGLVVPPEVMQNPVVMIAVLFGTLYLALGLVFLPVLVFFGERLDPRAAFALAKGQRGRLFAFLMVVALPFFAGSTLLTEIAFAQPAGDVLIGALVTLVAGFVNGLSYGPHLIGLSQAYFALRGEAPPTLNTPAGPRT